jgi:hypothetical protein
MATNNTALNGTLGTSGSGGAEVASAGSIGLIAGIAAGVVAVVVGMGMVSYMVVKRGRRARVAAATMERFKRDPVRAPNVPRLTPKPTELEVA